jgi:hypothetical protein
MLTIIFKAFKFFIIIFANFFILLIIDTNMKKALTFLMMTIMMIAVTTIISQTHEVYAENKAKTCAHSMMANGTMVNVK